MRNSNNLYEILQVQPNATAEVIEAAYKRLLRIYHPDVSKSPDAHEMTARLNAAYEVLGDPNRRAAYDPQWRQAQIEGSPRASEVRELSVDVQSPEVVRKRQSHMPATREQGQAIPAPIEPQIQRPLVEQRLSEERVQSQTPQRDLDLPLHGSTRLKPDPALDHSLQKAAVAGDTTMVLALMKAGANPYWKDWYPTGYTHPNAIELAAESGHTKVVEAITDVLSQGIYEYPSCMCGEKSVRLCRTCVEYRCKDCANTPGLFSLYSSVRCNICNEDL